MKHVTYVVAAMAVTLAACNREDTANMAANTAAANTATATAANTAAANMGGNAEMTNASAGAIDTAFVTAGIEGDNGEVAIGQLAAQKGSTKAVKDFGNMLATDHGAHKAKLAALASSANITVPSEPTAEAKATLDKLKGLSGAAFDKAFKDAMIEDHNKDIAKYEKQANSGDAKTAALAKETLPTLRKHLGIAKSL